MIPEYLLQAADLDSLPLCAPNRPRVSGELKAEPEDFVVEEIPAYEFAGEGDHRLAYVEKRNVSGGDLIKIVARVLGIDQGSVGTAGTKDKRAITRQWISVPLTADDRLDEIDREPSLKLLDRTLHTNKLRSGHLKGNRFNILIRGCDPALAPQLAETAEIIAHVGFPNFFGAQRFGSSLDTLADGLAILKGEKSGRGHFKGRFEHKMEASSAQAIFFNRYLVLRIARGQGSTVLEGDLLTKTATGGMFVSTDPATDQARLDSGEIAITGPMFGHKMMAPRDAALALEQEVLEESGLTTKSFSAFSRLAEGTRRAIFVHPNDIKVLADPDGIRVAFFLPKGCYATVLLREFFLGQTN